MNGKHHRYPGAQPFGDDEFSRRIFFGRDKASGALTDQILANRLVVVYAKSGSGKTSLLNAGVAPRLRDALHVPLFVRVNDRTRGPMGSVFEGIKSECERQKLEFVAGDTSSLWSFFKTVEFWRDDVLLTPVLILDQFEELFTLQSIEEREKFLAELGFLLRGTPPETHDPAVTGISAAPPSIRVVLSLREDFLGLLDEGSDRIPEIMDHRYRLAPLSAEMAGKAITGPAALESEGLATRAFQLKPECVASIVDYLSRSAASREEAVTRQVEPFHLQLICQMIESVAAFKQKSSAERVVLGFADIGGDAALAETLEDFYTDAINSLPRKRRRAARRMCANLLISVEGRRLSVDERELCLHSRLTRDDMRQLQERRLLRTDRRSDRTYYELGHDALVQPVLASRRTMALITYTSAIVGGSTIGVSMAVAIIALIAVLANSHSADDKVFVPICGIICVIVGVAGYLWLRAGVRLRTRYAEHDGDSSEGSAARPRRLKKFAGWAMLVIAPPVAVTWFIAGICFLAIAIAAVIWQGQVPPQLAAISDGAADAWPRMLYHPAADVIWLFLEYAVVVLAAAVVYRHGGKLLWPHGGSSRTKSAAVRTLKGTQSMIPPGLRALAGATGLILGILGLYTIRTCSSSWHGGLARWLQWPMLGDRLPETCSTTYYHYLFFSWDGANLFAFIVAIIVVSIAALWGGLAGLYSILAQQIATKQKPRFQEILLLVASCIVPIVVLTPLARTMWSAPPPDANSVWTAGLGVVAHSTPGATSWQTKLIAGATFESAKATTPDRATAVGKDGLIVHTTDGGKTWSEPKWGEGDHKGITLEGVSFPTPQLGWIAGQKGTLLKTEDGGDSWQQLDTSHSKNFATAGDLLDVWFATPQEGWAAAAAGHILHTSDGGHTWELQEIPQVMGQDKKPLAVDVVFIAFATPQCGWATGTNGTLFHTKDGGTTWTAQIKGSKVVLDGIAPLSCSTAWLAADKGTLMRTTDGGATWTTQNAGVDAHLIEIWFLDPSTGWTVGDGGLVLRTNNGGQTWLPEHSGTTLNLGAVWAVKR